MLATELADVAQAVLAYPPLSLQGQSPVVSIHSGGTTPNFHSFNTNLIDHTFVVTIFINREAHGITAEDVLDQMYTAVITAVRENITGTDYMELDVAQTPSQPAFAMIDGLSYRIEEITVIARSNPTG